MSNLEAGDKFELGNEVVKVFNSNAISTHVLDVFNKAHLLRAQSVLSSFNFYTYEAAIRGKQSKNITRANFTKLVNTIARDRVTPGINSFL